MVKKIIENLNSPIPNISLALFRVCFSFAILIQTYYFFTTNFINENIVKPLLLFPFIEGIDPISETNLIILSYIMLCANIGMLLNKFNRLSTFIFFCCFTYFWILDKGYFNNHYYFISLICFLLIIVNTRISFQKKIYIPKVQLYSLQCMIIIVYFISGLNKINPYWLFEFQPMKHILEIKSEIINNPFLKKEFTIFITTYLGLFFDLFIGPLLLINKTRIIGFLLAFIFHTLNYYLFIDVGEIGIFPILMITTLILFIPTKKIVKSLALKDDAKLNYSFSKNLNLFILFFLVIQLILPFRHVFFKGDVDYNGIGQRFSWRMKIMYKESDINYFIYNPMNKEKYEVDVTKMLTHKQYNNLKYFPDLIVPLAKKIKTEAKDKFGIKNAKVTCEYRLAFMGKNEQLFFSPSINLANLSTQKPTNKWLWEQKK